MKVLKILIIIATAFFTAQLAVAQKTTVTATITDPNGVPYANGSVTAQLAPAGVSNPTVGGAAIGGNVGPAATDANGRFSMDLFSNTSISPGGTQWQFTICNPGVQPPLGFGNQCFTPAAITITGATQDVSTQLNAVAPVLTRIAGVLTFAGAPTGACTAAQTAVDTTTGNLYTCNAGAWQAVVSNPRTPTAAMPQLSHLIGMFWVEPGETVANVKDYSGHGNNGIGTTGTNPPTLIAGTGGLSCQFQGGAVILPSALNAATTIAVFAQDSGSVNSLQSPVIGNGAGATGHTIAINFTSASVGNAVQTRGFGIQSSSAAAAGFLTGKTFSPAAPIYPALITLAMGSGTDLFWADNVQLGTTATGSSLGMQDRGNYQLCGAAAGNGDNQNHWMFGPLYAAAFWDGPGLSSSDIAMAANAVHAAMLAKGFVFPGGGSDAAGPNPATNFSHWDGDSLSVQFGAAPVLNNYNGIGWTQINNAQNGQSMESGYANCSSSTQRSYVNSLNAGNVEVMWLGTDSFPSATAIKVYNEYAGCAQFAHAIGQKFIATTMLSRSGFDTQKNALNGLLLASPTPFDKVANPASWTNLGANGAFSNAAIFPDGVHPIQGMQINEIQPVHAAAHNHLYGNTSYDTATTYSAASAAPTATTAGSESGNTVTLTFASTPANCQAGNLMIVAGVTPAGYNSDNASGRPAAWQILTRTATQVTYFNPTTGLGAVSVQGTGVCPSQQDADVYALFTGFTGNWTLQPCELWSDGTTLHYKNVGAGTVTLVPFGSETIDNPTISAHAAIAFKSVNNAPSVAGCQWLTTQ